MSNPELSYDVWAIWRALGRRHLPSEILAEPSAMLNDILQIDAHYEALKRLQDDHSND